MRRPTKRNPIARDLRTPKYRLRVIRPRKGRGAYVRVKATPNLRQE